MAKKSEVLRVGVRQFNCLMLLLNEGPVEAWRLAQLSYPSAPSTSGMGTVHILYRGGLIRPVEAGDRADDEHIDRHETVEITEAGENARMTGRAQRTMKDKALIAQVMNANKK